MEDKRTEFLEVLNGVLKKVGLPPFYDTVRTSKVVGDNSHFTVSPFVLNSVPGVRFEIEFFDENGDSKWALVAKQFDDHDTWNYDSWPDKEAYNPSKLLEKIIEVLKTKYQNPHVDQQ